MDQTTLQFMAWILAFWTAVLGFSAWQERPRHARRFVLGLLLAAISAHLGWALLHLSMVRTHPLALLDPTVGYTVLTLPVGLLLTAPWRERAQARHRYLAACFGSLPMALVVARLGCLAGGCCHGGPTSLPWAVAPSGIPVHPAPLYEALAWVAVFLWVRRLQDEWVAPTVLIALGTLRLLIEPLRSSPPLGVPLLPPSLLAAVWVAVGIGLSPWVSARLPRPAMVMPRRAS